MSTLISSMRPPSKDGDSSCLVFAANRSLYRSLGGNDNYDTENRELLPIIYGVVDGAVIIIRISCPLASSESTRPLVSVSYGIMAVCCFLNAVFFVDLIWLWYAASRLAVTFSLFCFILPRLSRFLCVKNCGSYLGLFTSSPSLFVSFSLVIFAFSNAF